MRWDPVTPKVLLSPVPTRRHRNITLEKVGLRSVLFQCSLSGRTLLIDKEVMGSLNLTRKIGHGGEGLPLFSRFVGPTGLIFTKLSHSPLP